MLKTIKTLQKLKNSGTKIVSLTAYDYSTAKFLEKAGVDFILVGDSLAMVALGHKNTLSVTMEEMLHHTKAVVRGAPETLVVADMPFMSYQVDTKEAIINAGRFVKEAGAQSVKLEGASNHIINCVETIVETGIPVLGHLGFTPQFINSFGGYFIQAKSADKAEMLLEQALKLEQAGAYAIVLEMIPSETGKFVTENISIPTIGIGAGPYCDGQILVTDDVLGKYTDFTQSFVRKYANLATITTEAIQKYCNDVRNNDFPDLETESFSINEKEKEKLNIQ